MSYAVGIWAPAGRGGMAPTLSIGYSSHAGNSLLGVDWSLGGTSTISRCSRTRSQDGQADHVTFDESAVYCLDGVRLRPVEAGELPELFPLPEGPSEYFEFRTEHESWQRVLAFGHPDNPSSWAVFGADGLFHYYGGLNGSTASGARYEGTTPFLNTFTLAWHRARSEDRYGNQVDYEYERPDVGDTANAARVLKTITWGHSRTGGYASNRRIELVYEGRGIDNIVRWANGVRHEMPVRVSKIEVYAPESPGQPAQLSRYYDLTYSTGYRTTRSFLTGIEICSRYHLCLPATTFEYSGGVGEVAPTERVSFSHTSRSFNGSHVWNGLGSYMFLADFDGDGMDDLFVETREPESEAAPDERNNIPNYVMSDGSRTSFPFPGPLTEVPPYNGPSGKGKYRGVPFPADLDMDGDSEVVIVNPNTSGGGSFDLKGVVDIIDFTGASMSRLPSWFVTDGVFFSPSTSDFSSQFSGGDLNGDGYPDLLALVHLFPPAQSAPTLPPNTAIGTSVCRWLYDPSASTFSQVEECESGATLGHGVASDVDGDQRVEVTPNQTHTDVVLEQGTGLAIGSHPAHHTVGDYAPVLVDINGDGLQDRVYPLASISGQLVVGSISFNTGLGYTAATTSTGFQWFVPEVEDFRLDRRFIPVDINGDGRVDLVSHKTPWVNPHGIAVSPLGETSIQVLLSTGQDFLPPFTISNASVIHPIGVPSRWSGGLAGKGGSVGLAVGDVDGDGFADIVTTTIDPTSDCNEGPDFTCFDRATLHYHRQTYDSATGAPEVLTRVVDGLGLEEEVQYASFSQTDPHSVYDSSQCALNGRAVCMVKGPAVVRRHVTKSGDSSLERSYRYADGYRDLGGRGFVGFARLTTVQDNTGTQTDTFFEMAPSEYDGVWFYPRAASPYYRSVTFFNNNTPIVQNDTQAEDEIVLEPNYTYRLRRLSVEDRTYYSGSLQADIVTTTTFSNYDGYGTPRLVVNATAGGRSSRLTRWVSNDTKDWVLGRVDKELVEEFSGSETVKRQTDKWYFAGTGRVQRAETYGIENGQLVPETWSANEVSLSANGNGNVVITTQSSYSFPSPGPILDRSTWYEFGADGIHLSKVINPLGHTEQWVHNPSLGVVTAHSNPQCAVTHMAYDALGRGVAIEYADGTVSQSQYLEVPSDSHVPAAFVKLTTDSGGQEKSQYLDSLEREVAATYLAQDGKTVWQETRYDGVGRVSKRTEPGESLAGEPTAVHVYGYDSLSRPVSHEVLSRTDDLGNVVPATYESWRHNGLTTLHIDVQGREAVTTYNVDHDLVKLRREYANGLYRTTTFAYEPGGNVESITDAGTRRQFEYDALGRQILDQDPDLAAPQVVEYDGFGRVRRVTRPSGSVTELKYDSLDRPTERAAPDGVDSFDYDTCMAGRVCVAATSSGLVRGFSYDGLGRPTGFTWDYTGPTGPQHLSASIDLDALGRPEKLHYPARNGESRLVIHKNYGSYGYLRSVTDGSNNVLWRAEARTPQGRPSHILQGGTENAFGGMSSPPVLEQRVSWDHSHGRPIEHRVSTPDGAILQHRQYGLYPDGRVEFMTEFPDVHDAQGQRHSYTYDYLGRLTQWRRGSISGATGTGDLARRYYYTAEGALDEVAYTNHAAPGPNPASEDYVYGNPSQPHMATSRAGHDYVYDADGRRTHEYVGGQLYGDITYNSRDLPASGVRNGLSFSNVYAADGSRFASTVGSSSRYFFGHLLEERWVGATLSEKRYRVLVGGAVVAEVTQADPLNPTRATRFVIRGDQDSTSRVINGDGTLSEAVDYTPFGERIAQYSGVGSTGASMGFLGLNEDATALAELGFRSYDAASRTFLSSDSRISTEMMALGLVRNAYAYWDPVNRSDPSGLHPGPEGRTDAGHPHYWDKTHHPPTWSDLGINGEAAASDAASAHGGRGHGRGTSKTGQGGPGSRGPVGSKESGERSGRPGPGFPERQRTQFGQTPVPGAGKGSTYTDVWDADPDYVARELFSAFKAPPYRKPTTGELAAYTVVSIGWALIPGTGVLDELLSDDVSLGGLGLALALEALGPLGDLGRAAKTLNKVRKIAKTADRAEAALDTTRVVQKTLGKCFVEGTLVAVPNGYAEIQELEEGDIVLTQDAMGRVFERRVVKTFITHQQPVLEVTLALDQASPQPEKLRIS